MSVTFYATNHFWHHYRKREEPGPPEPRVPLRKVQGLTDTVSVATENPRNNIPGIFVANPGDMRCTHPPYSFGRFGRIVDNRETCFKSNSP